MQPIRILHIVTYMGRGGLETMLMNYYRHINRDKIQFDFLVHRDFEADYDKEIKKLGGKVFHISRLVPWSRKYKKELERFFKSHPEYRIVHVHQDCLSSIALKVAKECGIPVRIAHSHNSCTDKNLKYLIKLFYMRKIPNYATDLFACGRDAGDWMFRGAPYVILHNAISVKDYFPINFEYVSKNIRSELGVKDELLLGHVGRFMPQKNHEFLIDIFLEVVKQNSNVKLVLVGEGVGKEDIISKVNSLQLSNNVIFTGIREDVNKLMQAMDIFIFPSRYEGLPVTMIEAQASGLPCVISDKVPKECIITSNLISVMKLEESPKEWAEHILKINYKKRQEHFEEIEQKGYDIIENSKWLENFYLEKDGEKLWQ